MPKYVSTHRGFDIYRFEASETQYSTPSYKAARSGEIPSRFTQAAPHQMCNSESYCIRTIDKYLDSQAGQTKEAEKTEKDAAVALYLSQTEEERTAHAKMLKQQELDKLSAEKRAAEEERQKREAEEYSRHVAAYNAECALREQQRLDREALTERSKPTIALEPDIAEVLEPRPEPVEAPTEPESFFDTFMFKLKGDWAKLMEMIT